MVASVRLTFLSILTKFCRPFVALLCVVLFVFIGLCLRLPVGLLGPAAVISSSSQPGLAACPELDRLSSSSSSFEFESLTLDWIPCLDDLTTLCLQIVIRGLSKAEWNFSGQTAETLN